jgi:hypothetical protein
MVTMNIREKHESGQTWTEWLDAIAQNRERFQANYEQTELTEEDRAFLRGIERDVHILALGADWCGDVVRQFPIVARMCAENDHLHLRILNRDEHLDVMERYLFNGALSIPVFAFFNDQFIEVGNWKARPYRGQRLIARGKAAGCLNEARRVVQDLMNADNNRRTVEEIKALIAEAVVTAENWMDDE